MGKFEPIHRARHVDIREDQTDFRVQFEESDGRVGAFRLIHFETGLLDRIRRPPSNERLVLHNQNRGVWPFLFAHNEETSLPRKSSNGSSMLPSTKAVRPGPRLSATALLQGNTRSQVANLAALIRKERGPRAKVPLPKHMVRKSVPGIESQFGKMRLNAESKKERLHRRLLVEEPFARLRVPFWVFIPTEHTMSSNQGTFPDKTTTDLSKSRKEGGDAVANAKESASNLMSAAKSSASGVASSASDFAGNAAESFKTAVEDQKTAGAGAIGDVARAAKGAADNFQDRAPELANTVRNVADRVEGISNDIRDRSVNDLMASVTEFAGQKPMAFFGCGILAGLVISRLFTTSSR